MKLSFFYGIRFSDWRRVLRENLYAVHPFYWHRAAWITLLSLHNSWLQRKDAKVHTATDPVAPIFVIGHWRSGTTHLHNLLACDPQLAAPNTYQVAYPGSFLRSEQRYSRILARMIPGKRPQDNMAMAIDSPNEDEIAIAAMGLPTPYLSCHFPKREFHYRQFLSFRNASPADTDLWKSRYREYLRKLTHKHGPEKTLVLKSPAHTARIPLLLEMFPDARFVHIHRDPYDTFVSTMHLHQTWNSQMAVFQRLKMSPAKNAEIIIEMYRSLYRGYLEDKDQIPAGQLHTVRFSDLEESPTATLRPLYDRFSLPAFPAPSFESYLENKAVHSYERNRYPPLDPELKKKIAAEWSFAFEAFGYEP